MCNSFEGSIEGLVFGADLIRFKGVYVKRQKIHTKEINLIAYEWRFCGVIWNVSKEKRAGSKIILCLYSLVKILHSIYCSAQLSSSMIIQMRTKWWGNHENFDCYLTHLWKKLVDVGILKLGDGIEMVASFHNKKWKEVKKQFQFVDSLDSFSTSFENSDLQCLFIA